MQGEGTVLRLPETTLRCPDCTGAGKSALRVREWKLAADTLYLILSVVS